MIKVEVIKEFTLGRYEELTNIVRKGRDQHGKLFVGDIFECSEDMVKYLTGSNSKNDVVVKILEVKPEEKVEIKEETTEEVKKPKKTYKKKTSKK